MQASTIQKEKLPKDSAQVTPKPSLKNLLLSDTASGDLIIPKRGKAQRRKVKKTL